MSSKSSASVGVVGSTNADKMRLLNSLLSGLDQSLLGEVGVRREGTQIIIPNGMSIDEAITWLERKKQSEEKIIAVRWDIPCAPLDGGIALSKALKKVYGFTALSGNPSFFGERPPQIIRVPTSTNSFEEVILGRMQPPAWEKGYLQVQITGEPKLVVTGEIKAKFSAAVDEIQRLTIEILKAESIYKGKAIILDMSYLDENNFDPITHAPTFMDVSTVVDKNLILNRETEMELTANIFTLIERSQDCRDNNIPLKHGLLLYGPFGTGKSMTARVTAAKCERNGWTFIYLKQTQHIAAALKLAELHAPAVVFAEDIDQIMAGERDENMNKVLNTLDGIDTKDKPIITILTTNNHGNIQPGFLRAGRIDTAVFMGPPDCETAGRFVQLYGGKLLSKSVDLEACGKAFTGFVPAFIAEAIQKAKRFVIHREQSGNIDGKVTTADLVTAAQALKTHRDMVNNQRIPTDAEIVQSALKTLAVKCFAESSGGGENQPDHAKIFKGIKQVHDAVVNG